MKLARFTISKKTLTWLAAAGAILVAGIFIVAARANKPEYIISESLTLSSGPVQSSLMLSGRVEADSTRDVSFPVTGRLSQVAVEVGDTATTNELLASLDTSLLSAERREAEAEVAIQEAVLANLIAGTRPEEIAVKQEAVNLAQLAYNHALDSTQTLVYDAYTTADNAIRGVVDDFFVNPRSTSPELVFTIARNQGLALSAERDRILIESVLANWQQLLSGITDETELLLQSEQHLVEVRNFMNQAALAVNSADISTATPEATLRTWKTNTGTARTNVVQSLTELQTARQNLETLAAKITQATTELSLAQSGATRTDIRTQEETIAKARARLTTIDAQINERRLRAPLSGLVADVYYQPGETVTAGSAVLTIISSGLPILVLEAPELVLPQLSVGDRAQLTFLALAPHQTTEGTVTRINPQATIENGLVPYYEVEVTLDETSLAISPGLLADATIFVGDFADAIAIPRRFILDYDPTQSEAAVWLRTPSGIQRQTITIHQGLSDQRVLIESGLKTGDIIVRLEPSS